MKSSFSFLKTAALLIAFSFTAGTNLQATPFYVGPKTCEDCHKTEGAVFMKTEHSRGFKNVHKSPKAAAILAAAGGDKNMRKNKTCTQCHFTMEQDAASKPAVAKSGPSCESCHGPASDWLAMHNNFGGPGVKRTTESAEHKAKRIADSRAAGMVRPEMLYDIAVNCMECHGFDNPKIDPAVFGKMLDAGHPFNPDYELVRYSQGSVRHRSELTPAELSQMFVTGEAAKLVSASSVVGKGSSPSYKAAQQKRIDSATAALAGVKSLPEVAALLAAPTEDNARKLVAAIDGKDLSAQLKGVLPDKSKYK